ncbi:hypothetical protein [Vibrio sonorensis]|uniref:hypothetical protein n=1 Tax=Vibrio sonorensis TaxID=1004316 RepID=UPI0008DA26B2|nr:hypothetical protein [Vibrio sonorensis]
MIRKHHAVFVLALALVGCNNSSGDKGTTQLEVITAKKNCATIEGSEVCLPLSIEAQSGERVYLSVTGNTKAELSWHPKESDSLRSPVLQPEGNGVFITVPVTKNNGSIDIVLESTIGQESVELTTQLDVSGASNLIVNGINSILLNENSFLAVEWMPAITPQSAVATGVTYTLNVTRIENGILTDESRDFSGPELSQTVDVSLGETYRLLLSVQDANGVTTYTEHVDYQVANTLPELAPVVTDPVPDIANYDEGQLIDQNGELKIVRVNQQGDKFISTAKEFEAYKEEAPLVVSLRIKDLTEEEIAVLGSPSRSSNVAMRSYNTSPMHGDIKISLPEGYITQNEDDWLETADPSAEKLYSNSDPSRKNTNLSVGTSSACLNYSRPGVSAKACTRYDSARLICDAEFKLSNKPKVDASCYVTGRVRVTAEASASGVNYALMWPFPKIERDIQGAKLVVAPNLGLKGKFQVPVSIKSDFTVTASAKTGAKYGIGDFYLPYALPYGSAHARLSAKDGKLFNVTIPSNKTGTKLTLTAELGAFPEIKIGDFFEVSLEGAGKVESDATYLRVGTDESKKTSFLDANIKSSGYTKVALKSAGLYSDWLNYADTWSKSTPTWTLYKHPKKFNYSGVWFSQCLMSGTYPFLESPIELPEYGTLDHRDPYGSSFQQEHQYSFGGVTLVSVKPAEFEKSEELDIHVGDNNDLSMKYEEKTGPEKIVPVFIKLKHPSSSLGHIFPIYVVDMVSLSQFGGPPWVCWGSGFNKEKLSKSGQLTPLQAADFQKIYDGL